MTEEFKYLLDEASDDIDKGLVLNPDSTFGYTAKVQIEFFKKNWESMFNVAEKAYLLAENDPHVLAKIGQSLAFGGQCEEKDLLTNEDKPLTLSLIHI